MLVSMSAFGTSVFSLLPIVIGETLGRENVTSGVGINFVYQAFSVVVSTFSAGELNYVPISIYPIKSVVTPPLVHHVIEFVEKMSISVEYIYHRVSSRPHDMSENLD